MQRISIILLILIFGLAYASLTYKEKPIRLVYAFALFFVPFVFYFVQANVSLYLSISAGALFFLIFKL